MQFRILHLCALMLAFGLAFCVYTLSQSYWYAYVSFAVLFYIVLVLRPSDDTHWLSTSVRRILLGVLSSLTATSLVAAVHAYAYTVWRDSGGNVVVKLSPEAAVIQTIFVIVSYGLLFMLPVICFQWLVGKLRRSLTPANDRPDDPAT
ncbi:hypothetical protein Pan97_33640 [Bremerella volcania]|uniref:Uncharacterized protein n=1 Tax=Bremerella volcania TaxID=2527984 RepID=A0A518CAS7_9BACT|nr:hypothetical protein Pan97_33640 [Bremerella volcania]